MYEYLSLARGFFDHGQIGQRNWVVRKLKPGLWVAETRCGGLLTAPTLREIKHRLGV